MHYTESVSMTVAVDLHEVTGKHHLVCCLVLLPILNMTSYSFFALAHLSCIKVQCEIVYMYSALFYMADNMMASDKMNSRSTYFVVINGKKMVLYSRIMQQSSEKDRQV